MLFFWRVASSKLDAVGPRRPLLGHYHTQQRFVGDVVGCPVLDSLRWHNILPMSEGQLFLPFSRIMRLPYAFLMPAAASTATLIPRPMRLLPPIVQLLFGIRKDVLEHFLTPQVEEVVRIRVELQTVLAVLPVNVKFIERWRRVALMVGLQHRRGHGIPGDNLLVEHHRALERLPHVYVLQGHFLHVAVQLSNLHGQPVYPSL